MGWFLLAAKTCPRLGLDSRFGLRRLVALPTIASALTEASARGFAPRPTMSEDATHYQPDAQPLIVAEALSKFYKGFAAIEDISFSISQGEIVGFLGPNGAGKTTAMRILAGYMPPSAGAARIAGFDTVEASQEARRRVGYLPESVPLYNDLTIRGYLGYMGTLRGMAGRELKRRIDEAVETVHAAEYVDTAIGKLSKGYRQRVGIAQAILHNPPVVILDEPTVGIDPVQVVETRRVIQSLGSEHTVLLSSHILPEVSMVCGRVLIIHEGRLVADGDPDELAERLAGNVVVEADIRGPAGPVSAALSGIPGVASVSSDVRGEVGTYRVEVQTGSSVHESVAGVVVTAGWTLLRLQRAPITLEDVFVQLTEEDPVAHA